MAIAPIAITATPAAEIGDREDALTTASTSAAAPSTLLSPTPAALPSPKATPNPPPPWLTSIPSSGEPLAYRTAVTPSTSCGPPPPPPPENGPPRGDYSAAVHRVPQSPSAPHSEQCSAKLAGSPSRRYSVIAPRTTFQAVPSGGTIVEGVHSTRTRRPGRWRRSAWDRPRPRTDGAFASRPLSPSSSSSSSSSTPSVRR